MPYVLPYFQNPPQWNPSWLSKACTTRKDPESEWLTRDNPETNPITIKPETVSHVAEQFSWVSLPSCCLPRLPFPKKSLALSTHVSPQTIHFQVLDKSMLYDPGRGPPSCNTNPFLMAPLLPLWGYSILCSSSKLQTILVPPAWTKEPPNQLFSLGFLLQT